MVNELKLAHLVHKYLLIILYMPVICVALEIQLWKNKKNRQYIRALVEFILYWFHLKCLFLLDPSGQVLINFLCTVFQFHAKSWLHDMGFILRSQFVQYLSKLWEIRKKPEKWEDHVVNR